jgi:N-acetylneuraminate synthase
VAELVIQQTKVGPRHPVYFIADIASNHAGSLEKAKELVHACAESGVNAVKMQNYTAEGLVSDYGFKHLAGVSTHQDGWGKSVFDSYRECAIPLAWTEPLKELCDRLHLDYFTSPYGLDLVEAVAPHVGAFKVGSGDITWHEEVRAMARHGKPVLLATGASTWAEVEGVMQAVLSETKQALLMQCNTNYTARPDEPPETERQRLQNLNLAVLGRYGERWPEVPLGLSDHTHGSASVLAAVGLYDACAVEKHFTLDNTQTGQDHPFSTTPAGWKKMVDDTAVLKAELGPKAPFTRRYDAVLARIGDKVLLDAMLGDGVKRVQDNERGTVVVQRRAVRAVRALPRGARLTESDLVMLRPCPEGALAPYQVDLVVGKSLVRDVPEGDVVRLADVAS